MRRRCGNGASTRGIVWRSGLAGKSGTPITRWKSPSSRGKPASSAQRRVGLLACQPSEARLLISRVHPRPALPNQRYLLKRHDALAAMVLHGDVAAIGPPAAIGFVVLHLIRHRTD